MLYYIYMYPHHEIWWNFYCERSGNKPSVSWLYIRRRLKLCFFPKKKSKKYKSIYNIPAFGFNPPLGLRSSWWTNNLILEAGTCFCSVLYSALVKGLTTPVYLSLLTDVRNSRVCSLRGEARRHWSRARAPLQQHCDEFWSTWGVCLSVRGRAGTGKGARIVYQ